MLQNLLLIWIACPPKAPRNDDPDEFFASTFRPNWRYVTTTSMEKLTMLEQTQLY